MIVWRKGIPVSCPELKCSPFLLGIDQSHKYHWQCRGGTGLRPQLGPRLQLPRGWYPSELDYLWEDCPYHSQREWQHPSAKRDASGYSSLWTVAKVWFRRCWYSYFWTLWTLLYYTWEFCATQLLGLHRRLPVEAYLGSRRPPSCLSYLW